MADEDPELRVKVTTESDGSGAEEASHGIDEIRNKSRETAGELRHLLGSAREGKEVLRGLEAGARGGAAGLGEMTRGLMGAARAASALLGSGPFGALVIVLGLLAGAWVTFKAHTHEAGQSMDDASKDADKLKKSLEDLKSAGESSIKPLVDEMKELDGEFKNLEERITAASGQADKQNDAQRELAKSARELAKEKELEGAKDETARQYIEKKFTAQEHLEDANQKVIESTKDLNDAKVKQAAADQEAAEKADVASRAESAVAESHARSTDATKKAAFATSFFEEQIAKPGTSAAIISVADAERKAANVAAQQAQAFEKGQVEKSVPLRKEADEAATKAAAADRAVEQAQLTAETKNTTALNELAKAIIELREAEAGKQTGTEDAKEEKAPQGETKEKKETTAARQEQAADENHLTIQGEKALERIQSGSQKLHQAITRHAKATEEAQNATIEHLDNTAKRAELTQRQVINSTSYTGH